MDHLIHCVRVCVRNCVVLQVTQTLDADDDGNDNVICWKRMTISCVRTTSIYDGRRQMAMFKCILQKIRIFEPFAMQYNIISYELRLVFLFYLLHTHTHPAHRSHSNLSTFFRSFVVTFIFSQYVDRCVSCECVCGWMCILFFFFHHYHY